MSRLSPRREPRVIPTGVPIVYEMEADLSIVSKRELGDPEAIAAAAEAVRRQGER